MYLLKDLVAAFTFFLFTAATSSMALTIGTIALVNRFCEKANKGHGNQVPLLIIEIEIHYHD